MPPRRLFVILSDGERREIKVWETLLVDPAVEQYPMLLFNVDPETRHRRYADTYETVDNHWINPDHVVECWWQD